VSAPAYDRIGLTYSEVRRADPRFEAAIRRALGDAKRVLNIGASRLLRAERSRSRRGRALPGDDRPAPSAQRPADAAAAIQGTAESLPLEDKSVDATMGVFTMQHWDDVDRGLAEVLRVTRERIVFLTLDLDVTAEMWLCHDYLPEIVEHDRQTFPTIAHLQDVLPDLQVDTVLVPGDCTDGFCVALWSRPEAHLDPAVRRASSIWHLLAPSVVDSGLDRLRQDLENGKWDHRYGQLRTQAALDVGVRLVKAHLR
jgi:SAM-dependent methyltransferase